MTRGILQRPGCLELLCPLHVEAAEVAEGGRCVSRLGQSLLDAWRKLTEAGGVVGPQGSQGQNQQAVGFPTYGEGMGLENRGGWTGG